MPTPETAVFRYCSDRLPAAVFPLRRPWLSLEWNTTSAYTENGGEPALQERYFIGGGGGTGHTQKLPYAVSVFKTRGFQHRVDSHEYMDFR